MQQTQALHARLERIAAGYRASQVLFTATRLGVFAALEPRGLALAPLARTLAADVRATRILCDALVSLRLLQKTADGYRNAVLAREFLLPGAPRSQNALFFHSAGLYERWGKLIDVVKTGRPIPRDDVDPRLAGNEHTFARAMASSASLAARETAARLDLSRVRTLLDIGGGPGLYAIELARKQPRLKAVIFDNEKTLEVARENLARAGLAGRISVKAGDALQDDLGAGYDFILVSNLIHVYAAEVNQKLVARAAAALAAGGRLCIKDFLLNRSRTGPEKASLFAVNMLVSTDGGDCYSLAEIKGWLQQAGLKYAGHVKLTPPSRLVLGRRPG